MSYGSSLTPPGSANFQLNAGATNQNNPNVDPQESVNYEVGSKWDLAGSRLQLTGAFFWTENKNVIFVVDAHGGPADLQPGRRAEGEGRDAVARRQHHAVAGRPR